MKFELRTRTESDTQEFLTWRFEGEYSFYDNSIQQEKIDAIKNMTGSDMAFSVYNQLGQLVGNCEFYNASDDENIVEIAMGVQMKPELTGNGHGYDFCKVILEQSRKRLGFDKLLLFVADFNKRARKVYEKLGFVVIDEDIWTIRGNDYKFIIMELKFMD